MSDQLNFTKRTLEALPVTGAQYVVKDKKTMGLILLVSQKCQTALKSFQGRASNSFQMTSKVTG